MNLNQIYKIIYYPTISGFRGNYIMNFFIDKENSVLFISFNQTVDEEIMQKIRDQFNETDLPYKYVIVDNIYTITSV